MIKLTNQDFPLPCLPANLKYHQKRLWGLKPVGASIKSPSTHVSRMNTGNRQDASLTCTWHNSTKFPRKKMKTVIFVQLSTETGTVWKPAVFREMSKTLHTYGLPGKNSSPTCTGKLLLLLTSFGRFDTVPCKTSCFSINMARHLNMFNTHQLFDYCKSIQSLSPSLQIFFSTIFLWVKWAVCKARYVTPYSTGCLRTGFPVHGLWKSWIDFGEYNLRKIIS